MSDRIVALLGPLAAGAEETIREQLPSEIALVPVPDPSDRERVVSALRDAQVAVGDWPTEAVADTDVELVQQIGAGTENYDRETLPSGATLCNVYGHGPAIAEHVVMVLLALRRDLVGMDANLREGEWPPPTSGGDFEEVRGTTLGIVGYGTIGRAIVELAAAFHVDVIATRGNPPARTPDDVRFLGGPDDLDRILDESDAVVLSVPLTDATESLIGEREFELMKDDALLINVARGPVVDQAALYDALTEGEIGGAAIDTWYNYPDGDERCDPADYPFHELDNVLMTPHASGWTVETARYRWGFIADNIERFYEGEELENVVWVDE